jgi:hypothetical protein
MKGSEAAVVNGFNEYITSLKMDAGDKVLLSLSMFDSTGINVRDRLRPIEQVLPMTRNEFQAGAMTPLHDAVANTILEHDRLIVDQNIEASKILMVIHTDGQENDSREWKNRVHELIAERERTGFWTFVYLGSDINSHAEAKRMGISIGNTVRYDSREIGQTIGAASLDTFGYRNSPQAATNVFFQSGIKLVNGQAIRAKKRNEHLSSDGVTKYTATQWADDTWSCNCPGWGFNKMCKHIGGGTSAVVK